MRWTKLVVGLAMTVACGGDDTSSPADEGAASDAAQTPASTTTSDPAPDPTDGSVVGSSTSDTTEVACYDDRDCPGTKVCVHYSFYDSGCEPSGECSSKVACPPGFECLSNPSPHYTTQGECVPEDASTSAGSTSTEDSTSTSSLNSTTS